MSVKASDGNSQNSPFAVALVEHLPTPGLDLRKAFGYVRDGVLKNTGNKQEPYLYGSLGGDDFPLVPAKPLAAAPAAPQPNGPLCKDYELALQLDTRDGWRAFLAHYPEGFYADLAKGQLNKIAAPPAELDAKVGGPIDRIVDKSPTAIGRGKYAMRATGSMSFDESIAYTESQIALLARTEDAKEGLKAFSQKRKPSWPGR